MNSPTNLLLRPDIVSVLYSRSGSAAYKKKPKPKLGL